MHFRATAARWLIAGTALAAFTVAAPGLPSASAAGPSLTAKPSAAKPNTPVVVTGKIPGQAGKPYTISQIYTNNHVARVQSQPSNGSVAGPGGEVTANVTVPAGAARSDVLRPYGSWQYDVVSFNFGPGCSTGGIQCTSYGVNVDVLPVRTDEHITLSTLSPRTGSVLNVDASGCVGGLLTEFARVIDGNGAYFPITGNTGGESFSGSADLSHGFRGKDGPQGAAHVSNPLGLRDSVAAVPCAQSEGPASVAEADHLQHLTMVIDITICPRTGSCEVSNAIAPAGQTPVFGAHVTPTDATVTALTAEPAGAISAQPTFVG